MAFQRWLPVNSQFNAESGAQGACAVKRLYILVILKSKSEIEQHSRLGSIAP
jgi:hypothetical protein